MNIALVAVAYNGYGRFVKEWCEYIKKSTQQPSEVVVMLGKDHNMTLEDMDYCTGLLDNLVILFDETLHPTIGRLTNSALEYTSSEWVMPMDIDDLILPWAIETFGQYENDADYLCIAWYVWHKKKRKYRQSPTPETIARMHPHKRQKVRVNNNSPFRRKFWEQRKYDENNYLNLQFIAHLVESGAKFVKVPKACIVYRQWHGSLFGSDEWKSIKPEARKANLDMYKRLEKYYGVKR